MSAGTAWALVATLMLATLALKAAGPIVTGGRTLPPRAVAVVVLLPAALLAALVVTDTLTDGHGHLAVSAGTAGVLAASAVAWRTGSVLPAIVTAAVVTALLRLVL